MSADAVKDLVRRTPRWTITERAADPKPRHLHPLARFIDLSTEVRAPRYVIPGLIGEGVLTIAGQQGVGKTTAIVPLSMVAAGLHAEDDPLAPKPGRWRHVVYVSEDVAQVERTVSGIVNFGGLGIQWSKVKERFHLVAATRLPINEMVKAADTLRDQLLRMVDGVELRPLIVLDTKSSAIEQEEENSNSEASKVIAGLKQRFHDFPIWIVTHIAKADFGRSDVLNLSARGAGALEADAHGTAFLIQDGDERYLVLGKVRFEPACREMRIRSCWHQTHALNAWGECEPMTLRWGIAELAEESRAASRQRAQEQARQEASTQLRAAILDAVATAAATGVPLSRAGVKGAVGRKAADVGAMVDVLISESWLYEVEVPVKQRTNNRRSAFLIRLNDDERRQVLAGRPLPPERVAIPPSWSKAAHVSSVPSGNERTPSEAHDGQ